MILNFTVDNARTSMQNDLKYICKYFFGRELYQTLMDL